MAEDKELEELKSKLADATASIEKLKAKNDELIAEKRSTKTGAEAKLADAEAKIDELTETLAKSQRDHDKALKAAEKARDEALQAVEGERGAVSKLVLENGLTDALQKAGVTPTQLPAVRAYLKEKGVLAVESEGDVRRAVAKLVKDGKESKLSVEEYVNQFAASDEGKAFIPASGNAGSGAGGQRGGAAVSTRTQAELSAMAPKDRAAFFAGGGVATD